jgi:hypothetical protein
MAAQKPTVGLAVARVRRGGKHVFPERLRPIASYEIPDL